MKRYDVEDASLVERDGGIWELELVDYEARSCWYYLFETLPDAVVWLKAQLGREYRVYPQPDDPRIAALLAAIRKANVT